MTPNIGFGFNNAFESCAALTNQLHKLLNTDGLNISSPSTSDLAKAFQGYQSRRFRRAKHCHDISGLYTGLAAWDHIGWKWFAYISPVVVPASFVVNRMAVLVKGAVKLDFLEVPAYERGSVAFDDEVEGSRQKRGSQERMVYVALSIGVISAIAWALQNYVGA